MSGGPAIIGAYDGSSAALKGLSALGWGPLLNLGYFPVWGILSVPVDGLARYQRALALRSIDLLDPRPGERILDVGCGRGWTTAEIARRGADALGLDLLHEHVALAHEAHGARPGLAFAQGDARDLADLGTFDGVHCLEAAFHFGAEGRRAFLASAFRVLRPGGRLVLVDFAWGDDQPEQIDRLDDEGLVRTTWRFDEFEPLERYRRVAAEIGFRERALHDWTTPVLVRVQRALNMLVWIASFEVGKAIGRRMMPGLRALEPEDWDTFSRLVGAHDRVRRRSRYVALVLERPATLDREGRGGQP